MANLKHMNNDMAVSPIVATLVLIVVAVIGAVAVGTIMGTFSTDVSKQANAGNAQGASQTEIIVAGSTTVDPVTQAIAKIYNKENPGVKVSSQATGSGAGFQAVTLGVADIGAMSEDLSAAQKAQNANAQVYRIGSGAVVVITNSATPANALAEYTLVQLNDTFAAVGGSTTNAIAGLIPVYRSDSSGTADTFFKFISNGAVTKAPTSGFLVAGAIGKSGNAALVQYVGATKNTIGFADFGYVATRTDTRVQGINDGVNSAYTAASLAPGTTGTQGYDNLVKVAQKEYRINVEKTDSSTQTDVKQYNLTLIHPLNYITNGNPNTIQNSFINFARSGDATQAFKDTNAFALSQIF